MVTTFRNTATFDKLGNVTDVKVAKDDLKMAEHFFVNLYSPALNTKEVKLVS